jgi:hypothetical protein
VLETVLTRGTSRLGGTEGSLKQRYEHETRLLLGGLQHVAARDALMKASDLLIASAETWTGEMRSERSVEARDAAKRERATQLDTARRFIEEALANAPGSDG